MLRIVSIMLITALFLALPGGAIAQDNSGIDAYTENPPSAGGSGSGGDGTSTDPSATGSGTGFGTDAASGVGSSGSSGAAGAAGAGLTEAQAAAAGISPNGQLPATGLDETWLMGVLGLAMLAGGVFWFRRLA